MKTHIKVSKEVEISKIIIDISIRHVGNTDDDDVRSDFPLLEGNQWKATVMIDTGAIIDWPSGAEKELYCKVCDAGIYTLISAENEVLAVKDGYVPHGVIPGEYGDYVHLIIDADGIIKNWPETINVNEFFEDNED